MTWFRVNQRSRWVLLCLAGTDDVSTVRADRGCCSFVAQMTGPISGGGTGVTPFTQKSTSISLEFEVLLNTVIAAIMDKPTSTDVAQVIDMLEWANLNEFKRTRIGR